MSRALAHIEVIHDIKPIEGADKIELVHILGWQCVANKGEFKEGDLCVYFEIDSRVDYTKEPFTFMEKRKGKIKTIKLRGQLSQGLALSLDKFPQNLSKYKIGDDLTKILNVAKIETEEEKRLKSESEDPRASRVKNRYSKFIKSKFGKFLMRHKFTRNIILTLLGGKKKNNKWPVGLFPGVNKTDQPRCENMPWVLKDKSSYTKTLKVDGTSSTYILSQKYKKYHYYVCSRNVRMYSENQKNYHSDSENLYWQTSYKYKIKETLKDIMRKNNYKWIALQGEIAGCSLGGKAIQGDPHGLKDLRFFGFHLTTPKGRIAPIEARKLLAEYNIDWVPILDTNYILPDDFEEFKLSADGPCDIKDSQGLREGFVYYKNSDPTFSFKNVSREYLLKH